MKGAELALNLGVSPDLVQRWAESEAPAGIDPQVWADAQRTRMARAGRWEEQALERLPHYMSGLISDQAPTETASAAEAA